MPLCSCYSLRGPAPLVVYLPAVWLAPSPLRAGPEAGVALELAASAGNSWQVFRGSNIHTVITIQEQGRDHTFCNLNYIRAELPGGIHPASCMHLGGSPHVRSCQRGRGQVLLGPEALLGSHCPSFSSVQPFVSTPGPRSPVCSTGTGGRNPKGQHGSKPPQGELCIMILVFPLRLPKGPPLEPGEVDGAGMLTLI